MMVRNALVRLSHHLGVPKVRPLDLKLRNESEDEREGEREGQLSDRAITSGTSFPQRGHGNGSWPISNCCIIIAGSVTPHHGHGGGWGMTRA